MTDREKVISRIENWRESCPFEKCVHCGAKGKCTNPIFDDVLALLKEQEPRVMVLEEVLASDKPFLIEVVTGNITWGSCFGRYCLCNEMIVRMVDNDGAVDDRYEEMYGTKWRCWTSRPTEEQRKNTPWETDDA